MSPRKKYLRRSYLLPPALEELVCCELWSAGTLGVHLWPQVEGAALRLDAYYDSEPQSADDLDQASWRAQGVQKIGEHGLDEEDWLASYRRQAQPFPLGRRFWIDPREGDKPSQPPPPDRLGLHIPARRAFGTGSHESTRLVVGYLEELPLDHLGVLDVGTGSGILAFVALLLGAGRVVALDADQQSVFLARENGLANRASPTLFAGRLAALSGHPTFDLAVVNILPHKILAEIELLSALLAPNAQMIFSGIPRNDADRVLEFLENAGYHASETRQDGEWIAYLLGR